MKKMPKLIFLKIVFALLMLLLFLYCGETPISDLESDDNENEDKIVLTGMEAYSTEVGKPQQKVTAKRATFYELTQQLELEDVRVEFKPDELSTGTLTAQKGILYLSANPSLGVEKNEVFLEGEVTYTNLEGVKMVCRDIHWNTTKGLSSKSSFYRYVPMKDSVMKFEGTGFLISPDFKVWTDYGAKVLFSKKQKEIN